MSNNISDAQFVEAWKRLQSSDKVAVELGIDRRTAQRRKKRLQDQYYSISTSGVPTAPQFYRREHNARTDCTLENGVIVVGSDVHKWPGPNTVAQQAFINVIEELRPQLIVLNGDVFDGAGVSRWPKSSFGHKIPSVKEELDAVHKYLTEIEHVAKGAKRWWTIGNHDMRFESKLANLVPEFEGVPGFSLQEQFPLWPMSMSMMVNDNIMIKHRFRNGLHATYNNTLVSGKNIVTGHLHRLQATVFTDYDGSRWGIDTGTLGDTDGPQMAYGEDNPANHCSGFAVLTIVDGKLIHPEFCAVQSDRAFFRGRDVT